MHGGTGECDTSITFAFQGFDHFADVCEHFVRQSQIEEIDVGLGSVTLFADEFEIAIPIGPASVCSVNLAWFSLFLAESKFGGAEHSCLGECGIHFQRLESAALPYPVDVGDHLSGLAVVKHAVDGAGGLRGGGTNGLDTEK